MKLRLVFILLLFVNLLSIQAQKIERVHGEYTYHVPENITLEEGKRIALERAKIQALADAFGTIVSQNNSTIVKNENGRSSVDFFSLGGSEVKGEWIETTGEPTYHIYYESNMLVVKAEVTGKARKIKNVGVCFDARVLRNGTELKFESNEFQNGDDLYLYFKSPMDGYLVVYLVDENAEQAYCLLPYKNSNGQAYKILHDTPYVFFSKEKAGKEQNEVDEYVMTCNHSVEQNVVYVIFSPNAFAKMNMDRIEANFPSRLSLKEFQKMLLKYYVKNNGIQKQSIILKIRNNGDFRKHNES